MFVGSTRGARHHRQRGAGCCPGLRLRLRQVQAPSPLLPGPRTLVLRSGLFLRDGTLFKISKNLLFYAIRFRISKT